MALPLDLRRDAERFGAIVHIGLEMQGLTGFFLRIDGLLYLIDILMNKRICGIDDGLRGAVVAFEFEQLRLRVDLAEVQYIAYVRAAEGIDGLRVVAHHADVVLRLGEFLDQQELDVVGVLILIDEDVLELLLVFLTRFGTGIEQTEHVDEQVIEVHRVRGFESGLVEFVDGRQLIHAGFTIFAEQVGAHPIFAGTDPAVLRHRDTAEDVGGFVDLLIETTLFADRFDDRFAVGRIVDGEIAGKAELIREWTNEAGTDAMKSAHEQVPCFAADEFIDTLLHLSRGFVGEGEGHDTSRRNALLQEVGDAVSEDAGLTRSGAGHDERRPFRTGHGLPLSII